jgi:uncharacterized damage-inducible protein DinB
VACLVYGQANATIIGKEFMDLTDYFQRQFVYDAWANREVLTAIQTGGDYTARPLALMAHIVSAEGLWLERLKGEPQSLPVWPDFDFHQCEAHAEDLARLWPDYLKMIRSGSLVQKISYQNSKGEAWNSTVQDVLTHVVMHSAYHRGQVAALMRSNGQTPASTDFIHAVRQGLME